MEIQNYVFQIGKRQIVAPRNITFLPGKLNIITGANGSGKSSLLDFIAGVGSSATNGKKIDWPHTRTIAYQLQKTHFFPNLTVAQTIRLFRSLSYDVDTTEQPLLEAAKASILDPLASTPMGRLSGGEQQMVLTYGHCLLDKELYLFDEPMSGVDSAHAEVMLQLIDQLATARGKTVVMVTHHVEQLEGMAFHHVAL
ncbi:ATP-binding cassette domain-containing protein [Leuconostoc holzapfelii]|uniref:ATP-binding cassette domain-containing protein n=1 Tax=Leuconostoc holzapfelii TaxID=434464 RepID=A0A846ZHA4_9LACO|nr:ATP-binding cassette domain-containing protein [Leuconostoc holzapfelii]NKZ18741.1 ATP-binding cassette domain-containing protein [Leuconostoc holzapfelii]